MAIVSAMITYTNSSTCRQSRTRSSCSPKFHRNLCECCGGILSTHDEFHCKKERWHCFCSCIVCNIRSRSHWNSRVGIWSTWHCMIRRNLGWLDSNHKHTNCKPCQPGGRSCKGTNLCEWGGTSDERNARRTILSFAVGDAFRDRYCFVGGEVGDIIGRWISGGGGRCEDFRRRHERISEVSLSFYKDRVDALVVGSFP